MSKPANTSGFIATASQRPALRSRWQCCVTASAAVPITKAWHALSFGTTLQQLHSMSVFAFCAAEERGKRFGHGRRALSQSSRCVRALPSGVHLRALRVGLAQVDSTLDRTSDQLASSRLPSRLSHSQQELSDCLRPSGRCLSCMPHFTSSDSFWASRVSGHSGAQPQHGLGKPRGESEESGWRNNYSVLST